MNRTKSLESILVLAGALIVFYFILNLNVLLIISVILIAIGIFSKVLTHWISWIWLKFSEILGYVISKIILTLVFFILLTPIAFISRLFRKDHLRLRRKPKSTNYISREHDFISKDFENVW